MRALILLVCVLVIVGAHPAIAGMSTTTREMSAPVDTATITEEANRQGEDQIGLTMTKRREVQRRLSRLGFDTAVSGTFDDSTRDAIARWQDENGYPKTGFLTTTQHQALLSEAAAVDTGKSGHRRRVGRVHHARHARGIGGPFRVIGGLVGGLFRR
jgi:peptidoglycan hydrolase-like protein with peptidoglycan-binding domain